MSGSLGGLTIFRVSIAGAMAESFVDQQATWWQGLHKEWDDIEEVRARLREGKALMLSHPLLKCDGPVERSIHNCRFNKCVLLPALVRWSSNGADCSPAIDFLYMEVELLYKRSKREVSAADIQQDAWALRKLLGLVKAQVSKTHVPQDSWLIQLQRSQGLMLVNCNFETIPFKYPCLGSRYGGDALCFRLRRGPSKQGHFV